MNNTHNMLLDVVSLVCLSQKNVLHMKYLVSAPPIEPLHLKGTIELPYSKSISNRLLIIRALTAGGFPIRNLADSDDTRVLHDALQAGQSPLIDIGHAGTAMRFLTAYLAITPGVWQLTGSERMRNRPIGVLVEALKQLGAEINYLEKEGYPPLQIHGKALSGSELTIDGSVSSQFITALLLIAPVLPKGLVLKLSNKVISFAYINMTLRLMAHFGIKVNVENNNVFRVSPQQYQAKSYSIEADWSAASYWYEIAALADSADLRLTALSENSLQGDAIVSKLFDAMGVQTEYEEAGIRLIKEARQLSDKEFRYNFIQQPDLAQTFAVTLAMIGMPFFFNGLETLKIKETDRIQALQNELFKLGYKIDEPEPGQLTWQERITENNDTEEIVEIATYKDHRMAMAFAPVALELGQIIIQDPMVVTKSYPQYWEHIQQVGFTIEEI